VPSTACLFAHQGVIMHAHKRARSCKIRDAENVSKNLLTCSHAAWTPEHRWVGRHPERSCGCIAPEQRCVIDADGQTRARAGLQLDAERRRDGTRLQRPWQGNALEWTSHALSLNSKAKFD